jgi:hypothetical protein
LEEIHGKLDPLVQVDLNPKTIATVMIRIEERSFLKKIDLSMPMKDVRKMLANELGLNAKDVTLFHMEPDAPFGLDRMTFPDRLLRCYNVMEGSEIHVIPKFQG